VSPTDVSVSADSLPESILRYVLRSGERVATRDGIVPKPFGDDRYFAECCVRSLLCLPITLRGQVIGALYLENTLTRQNYGAQRLAVLQLIASQAAISLENAPERVSRTGSFSWRPDTQEVEFSDELSRIYGIEGPPSLALLRERVHPEDRGLFDAMARCAQVRSRDCVTSRHG
jgi:GAF domain-containing protein